MRKLAALLLFFGAWPGSSRAASTHVYVLAIGNNSPVPEEASAQVRLRYADDDAAAFFRFAKPFAAMGVLLTDMDADTRIRFPEEAAVARPATHSELQAAVSRLRAALLRDQASGTRSSVLVLYSGHGARSGGEAHLLLSDTALTRAVLYDEVLAALPAQTVHLFVDSCYAEAVVRPRDVDASAVDLSADFLSEYGNARTLARFPNVGAVMASTGALQTHEWDAYGQGVFTQELISGLRGAADVNGDGRIEYSELHSFLAAANREVRDPRARLSVVTRAPAVDRHAAIIEGLAGQAHLSGIPGSAGHVFLEDQLGNRLADVHAEPGAEVSLVLPAERVIYVHAGAGEARFRLRSGEAVLYSELSLSEPSMRARGSLGDAMTAGLFASAFGPSYYRGFVDQAAEMVPVEFIDSPEVTRGSSGQEPHLRRVADSGKGVAASGRLAWQTGVETAVSKDVGPMLAIRAGYAPARFPKWALTVDLGRGSSQSYSEWRSVISSEYRWVSGRTQGLVPWIALQAGVGLAWQNPHGAPTQTTFLGTAGPRGGLAYFLRNRTAIELSLGTPLLAYREDDHLGWSLGFDGFLGIAGAL